MKTGPVDELKLATDRLVLFGRGRIKEVDTEIQCLLDFVLGESGPHVCPPLYD